MSGCHILNFAQFEFTISMPVLKDLQTANLIELLMNSGFYPKSCRIALSRSRLWTGFSKNRLAPASRQRLS
jgi:hypothetical protein